LTNPDRKILDWLASPPHEIPALSDSVTRTLRAIDDHRSAAQNVADAMAADPPLTARVLSLANSSLYNPLGAPCDELRDAVSRIGLDELRGIVIATGIVEAFSSIEGPFNQSAFWKHSIITGIAAAALAERVFELRGRARPGENPYFLAGLLHDIGILALLWFRGVGYGDVLDEAQRDEGRLLECERRQYGVDHATVGGALARSWGLPEHVAVAVQHHHAPVEAGLAFRPWAQVIHLAEWISECEGQGLPLDEAPGPVDRACFNALGIERDQIPELIVEFREAADHAEVLLRLIKS